LLVTLAKYSRILRWTDSKKGPKFPSKKRVTLMQEMMDRAKKVPGPMDYFSKQRKLKGKGIVLARRVRESAFWDAEANSEEVPGAKYDWDLNKVKVNNSGIMQFSKVKVGK
jgi:hypothetical protein